MNPILIAMLSLVIGAFAGFMIASLCAIAHNADLWTEAYAAGFKAGRREGSETTGQEVS